jgi:N-acetylmuramoyl-L-alanine amidase
VSGAGRGARFALRTGLILAAAAGCSKGASQLPADAGPSATPAAGGAECILSGACLAPPRAELVALSDSFAISAASKTGTEQAKASRLAGELRRRSWRTYHVKADAREAIEQFRVAAKGNDPVSSCETAQAAMVLEGEVEGDLTALHAAAYGLSKRAPQGACAEGYETVMHDLAAFRPPAAKLAEIDEALRAAPGDAGAASTNAEGPVVTPARDANVGPAKIERIEAFGARDAARVVIHLSGPAMFEVGHIAPGPGVPERLYIDLAKTSRGHVPLTRLVGGLVERVRLGAHQGSTRVVLDLNGQAWRRVFYLPEPFRIIADLATHAPQGEEAQAASLARRTKKLERVVVDPGHGGNDPGAIGPGGLKEKDVTLDIAHRIAPILARELGIVTMVTRDADRYVTLEERTARANAFHADLFVSIHCNASESAASRGIQSYVLDTSRDETAARVAARENATTAAASAQVGSLLTDLRLGHLSQESLRLANLIQKSTMASLSERYADTTNGGVKAAGFYVLLGAEMPSVLFEAAFISNPVEETRLQTADFRQKIADGIANALRAYQEGR